MAHVVGVDVGGTFTDLIVLDDATGDVRIAKVPSTLDNQAFGVLCAIQQGGVPLDEIETIVHGTTVTTNALLERKVASCGLITTKGFRDVLELGRRTRPNRYGLTGQFECLIPRNWRLEATERMDSTGNVVTPLDEDEVRAAAQALLDEGVESVVIHFLHSYINDSHERRAEEIVREMWPNGYVTRGSAIMSEYREYERGTTAAINASVQPVLHVYIDRLQNELTDKGYARDLLVMQGNGGTVSSHIVSEAAANTVMSGPASGIMAAAYTSSQAGVPHVITCDMGGTSCDVGLIRDGVPQVSSELEIDYAMPIKVPMVDVHTIGAGGGSIAFINDAGLLQVGPESAGAMPGPICYGRGGTRVTITDANMVLGRLNAEALLSVEAGVSVDDIRAAMVEQIAEPLGMGSAEEAANAIIDIANNKMAGALRMVSLARGHDPRDFALFAFGGAGPLHSAALAKELAVPTLLVPGRPGITNAVGCVVADVRHDFVNTLNTPLADVDMNLVKSTLESQIAEGHEIIEREGVEVEEVLVIHDADMQFQGQTHILTIPVGSPDVTREELHKIFSDAYFERFAVDLPEIRPVLVNLHTAVIGKRKQVPLSALMDGSARVDAVENAKVGERPVMFGGNWHDTPIYNREKLPIGGTFAGPAIVEQLDTTVVIEPGDTVKVDDHGNLIVSIAQAQGGTA